MIKYKILREKRKLERKENTKFKENKFHGDDQILT